MRRTPYLRPMSWISFWPSTLPVSAKPDGMSTAPGIFFSPHSTSAAATNLAGIANTATSTSPGTSFTLLYAWQPHDLVGGRVDRVDRALVAAVDQVLHHRVADLAGLARRADHRHRLGLHDAVHVAHDVFLLRPEARLRGIPVAHDAHVRRGGALLRREHRVQVHLRDLGEVGDELRDVFDQRRERVAVDRIGAAHALQHLGRLDAVEHRQRVLLRRWREPERDVLHHLDEHAAEAERHELAERGVGDGADDHFLAARQHLLHLHAQEVRLRVVLLGAGHDRGERLLPRPARS